jgi:hypothetical protein
MTEAGASPGDRVGVALVARLGGLYVVCGFGGAGQAAALSVTDLALPGCALEYATCVTGLAIGPGMRPDQREAGAQMVEIGAAPLCGLGRRGNHEQGPHQSGERSQVAGGQA